MEIFFIIIIIFSFSLIGYKLASFYITRKKFFSSLEILISNLEVDVTFSKDKLKTIIERNSNNINSNELTSVCSNICTSLNNKQKLDDSIFNDINILRKNEKELLTNFFSSLGKYDAYSQSKEIKSYQARINEFYIQANEECKKYAGLFIKLGAIIGLLVCLLII